MLESIVVWCAECGEKIIHGKIWRHEAGTTRFAWCPECGHLNLPPRFITYDWKKQAEMAERRRKARNSQRMGKLL